MNPSPSQAFIGRDAMELDAAVKQVVVGVERFREEKGNRKYYELLSISVESSPQEIKEAYRKLQKKHHPDIAGQEGHEYTMMLNEVYKVLMRKGVARSRMPFGRHESNTCLYSSWNGPLRPEALLSMKMVFML